MLGVYPSYVETQIILCWVTTLPTFEHNPSYVRTFSFLCLNIFLPMFDSRKPCLMNVKVAVKTQKNF